jgi:hypothetical protein
LNNKLNTVVETNAKNERESNSREDRLLEALKKSDTASKSVASKLDNILVQVNTMIETSCNKMYEKVSSETDNKINLVRDELTKMIKLSNTSFKLSENQLLSNSQEFGNKGRDNFIMKPSNIYSASNQLKSFNTFSNHCPSFKDEDGSSIDSN